MPHNLTSGSTPQYGIRIAGPTLTKSPFVRLSHSSPAGAQQILAIQQLLSTGRRRTRTLDGRSQAVGVRKALRLILGASRTFSERLRALSFRWDLRLIHCPVHDIDRSLSASPSELMSHTEPGRGRVSETNSDLGGRTPNPALHELHTWIGALNQVLADAKTIAAFFKVPRRAPATGAHAPPHCDRFRQIDESNYVVTTKR
jgi:hypothetical protein